MSSIQQEGGMNPIQIIFNNMDAPYKLIIGIFIILTIVYSEVIPQEYSDFADSLIGRIIGIGVIYGVIQTLGWVYGILSALAFLMIVQGSKRLEFVEGFNGGGSINEKKIIGKRWFVEKVLGETPKKIETDKVSTSAIEGINSGGLMM
jgi:hypothetical protein